MRSATFELLATIAAFKQGKKYLLQNYELVGCLVACLLEIQAEEAAVMSDGEGS